MSARNAWAGPRVSSGRVGARGLDLDELVALRARAEQPLGLPWTVRLFESVPIAPIWIGILVVFSSLALYVAYAYQVEWIDAPGQPSWHHLELVRFALYVFGGLGAWVGAALMERLLSAALG